MEQVLLDAKWSLQEMAFGERTPLGVGGSAKNPSHKDCQQQESPVADRHRIVIFFHRFFIMVCCQVCLVLISLRTLRRNVPLSWEE